MSCSPDKNSAPMAFRMNHSSAMCLPVLTGSKKLMWVHSDQIDLGGDGAALLDEAFSRFPYLTRQKTAALAQRCSLHPDQVRVWFMAQRLHYGISWEWEDIFDIAKRFRSEERGAQRKDGLQGRREGMDGVRKKRKNTKGKASAEKKMGEEEEGRERAQVQPIKDEEEKELEKLTGVGAKKQNKETVPGKKKVTPDKGEKVAVEEGVQMVPEGNIDVTKKKKAAKVNNVGTSNGGVTPPDRPLDCNSLFVVQLENQTTDTSLLTDNLTELLRGIDLACTASRNGLSDLKEKMEAKVELDGATHHTVHIKKQCHDADSPSAQHQPMSSLADMSSSFAQCNTKKVAQLEMMRAAFLQCQYPDSEQYGSMAILIGMSRSALVQWFNDMRYYVKKARPRWMTQGQHMQIVANIKYRQSLSSLARVPQGESETWDAMLKKLKRSSEEESTREMKCFT